MKLYIIDNDILDIVDADSVCEGQFRLSRFPWGIKPGVTLSHA